MSMNLPRFDAIEAIKESIRKTYGRRGQEVVRRNFEAVDASIDHLYEVTIPGAVTATKTRPPIVSDEAPDHIRRVAAVMLAGVLLVDFWLRREMRLTPLWADRVMIFQLSVSLGVFMLTTRFGATSTCRASMGLYNTRAEIDVLVEALEKARAFFS